METLEEVLSRSARALESYQEAMTPLGVDSPVQVSPEVSLTELISILTNVKVRISDQLKEKHHIIQVGDKTIAAIDQAIDLMLNDPTTEDKVNALQLALFGTNVPFWKVLRDIQNLLRVTKELKESGKKVQRTQRSKDI